MEEIENSQSSDNKIVENRIILDGIRYALNNQITWQHYAEAKNLCLLTISAGTLALLFSSMQNISSAGELETYLEGMFFGKGLGILFLILGATCSLILSISTFILLPKFDEPKEISERYFISWRYIKTNKDGNLIDYLMKYDQETQIKDVLRQQLLGSRITYRKYKLFNIGVIIYLSGLLGGLLILFCKHCLN